MTVGAMTAVGAPGLKPPPGLTAGATAVDVRGAVNLVATEPGTVDWIKVGR